MLIKNTSLADYQQYLTGKTYSDAELLDLCARIPNLLAKPVLTDGQRVLQGFDPERLAVFVRGAA